MSAYSSYKPENQFVETYLNEKALVTSFATVTQCTAVLKSFCEYLKAKGVEPEKAIKANVIGYLNMISGDGRHSKNTVSEYLGIIKTFYKYMVDNEYMEKNPARTVPVIKKDKRLPIYYTVEEMQKILMTADVDPFNSITVRLLYATAVRNAELRSIKVKDIDFDHNTIKVFGKGSKEREVLLTPGTAERLKKWISDNKLSSGDRVIDLETTALARRLRIIGLQSEIGKKVTPHKFRHTAATHIYQRTGDINAVSKILGHSNINTTTIYAHSTTDDLRAIYAKGHPLA